MLSRISIPKAEGATVLLLSIFLVSVAARGNLGVTDAYFCQTGKFPLSGTRGSLDLERTDEGWLRAEVSGAGGVDGPTVMRLHDEDWFFYWDRESRILWFYSEPDGILALKTNDGKKFSKLPHAGKPGETIPDAVMDRLPDDYFGETRKETGA